MPNLSVDLSSSSLEFLNLVSSKLTEGKKGLALEKIIQSITDIEFNGEKLSKDELMLGSKEILLNKLDYRGNIKTSFRNNFAALPYKYRWRLYELLYIWNKELGKRKELRFQKIFFGVSENISVNYTDLELEKKDPNHCAYLSLYINIKGKIGNVPVEDYCSSIRMAHIDKNSPIWISKYERFVSQNFINEEEKSLYKEILEVLNLSHRTAIQLDFEDLDKLIAYYKNLAS